MYGFVNGLAIVIAMAQLRFFHDANIWMYILVVITMAIVYFVPKITDKVPPGLVAIIFVTIAAIAFKLPVENIGQYQDISGSFPTFSIPDFHLTWASFWIVLPYSVLVALVGLIESLLTLSVLDEMDGKEVVETKNV